MFSAGTLTTAGSIRLSARTKAPSSRVSSNIVAACVCSVQFMSFQDLRASGLRRLSTVSTMACNHGNKGHDRQLLFFQHFLWGKKKGICWKLNETRNNCNGKWNTFWKVYAVWLHGSTANVLCVFMPAFIRDHRDCKHILSFQNDILILLQSPLLYHLLDCHIHSLFGINNAFLPPCNWI